MLENVEPGAQGVNRGGVRKVCAGLEEREKLQADRGDQTAAKFSRRPQA